MSGYIKSAELAVIWSSSDKNFSRNTVFNYALNAKYRDLWSDVYFIIWGPSAKLLAEDIEIRHNVDEMRSKGIKVSACAQNAYSYGVCDALMQMGVEIKGMQQPVAELLRRGAKVITF